jgi:hypothetical protein
MTWEELKATFAANIGTTYDKTIEQLAAAIEASPAAFEARIQAFFEALAQAKANLLHIHARLPNPPRDATDAQFITHYAEMKALYDALLQGLRQTGAVNASTLEIGNPIVIAVLGVGLTVAAVAWAISAYQYAVGLRDQTAFMAKELDARVEAMRTDKQLTTATATPPSVPADPQNPNKKPEDTGKGGGWLWLVAGLGLAAGAVFVLPKLGKG